jgi:methylenetetrahydrofolate dehydrogenase (NADP+)/methenyltetrahydrofolate cyclohydrolase
MNIDGKALAQELRDSLAVEVAQLQQERGITPGLTVILVGEDPASQVYVRNKVRQTKEVGMISNEIKMPAETSQQALLDELDKLNNDPAVHGILVQLPLPKHIDEALIIDTINGDEAALVPCTPQGCVLLAKKHLGDDLSGKHAVVIGRSNIVGKPVSLLLLQESCTVTIAHSRTKDLPALCATADILVAAVGRPEMVKADWVKPGATVIDVGINRIDTEDGKGRLVGDVDFADVAPVAEAITPVPGGVGPMTIACLLKNTVEAARRFG